MLQKKLSYSTKMEAMEFMATEVTPNFDNILSTIINYPQFLMMEPNFSAQQKDILDKFLKF
ncbi:MAG: hypothetical protein LBV77_01640 [Candidatus Adiutrix intracellularis]|nr:hypothetical protein [Candidatus Adiutrix intracellularis]